MDDLIEEIVAEMPHPVPEGHFIDLDNKVPHPIRLSADESGLRL